MKRNRVLTISLALVALFFLARTIFYTKEEVPDIPMDSEYEYRDKNARDLWLFHALLKESFEDVRIIYQGEEEQADGGYQNIIHIKPFFNSDLDNEGNSLYQLAYSGHTVLLSTSYLSFVADSITVQSREGYVCRDIDLFQDSSFRFEGGSSSRFGKNDLPYLQRLDRTKGNRHELTDFFTSTLHMYPSFYEADSLKEAAFLIDTTMKCYQVGLGKLCFHNYPYFFMNIASRDPDYLVHYNHVLSVLDRDADVVLVQSTRAGRMFKSPLRYILSKPSFRWACYLTVVLMLIFFFAESRRKRRAIPLLEKKKNTTLDFVDSISRLYRSTKRNDKLRDQMERNFYSYVEQKYFLFQHQEDFWHKLLSKSKVQPTLLDRLKNEFETKETLTDLQLQGVYNKLNMFYKTAE